MWWADLWNFRPQYVNTRVRRVKMTSLVDLVTCVCTSVCTPNSFSLLSYFSQTWYTDERIHSKARSRHYSILLASVSDYRIWGHEFVKKKKSCEIWNRKLSKPVESYIVFFNSSLLCFYFFVIIYFFIFLLYIYLAYLLIYITIQIFIFFLCFYLYIIYVIIYLFIY